jgi:undecaprenyl-diphosphatase
VVAFLPAAAVGLAGNAFIDDHLLEPVPIAAAWIVGGLAILLFIGRLRRDASEGTRLDEIVVRQAWIIGAMQVLALWPGVSRSLVTIVGALIAGLRLVDAVEFSFLLGLVTLSAASFFSAAKDGAAVVDAFGYAMPLLGIVVAGASAAVAVTSLVAYLGRRDLKVFGWYRLAAGALTLALVAANVI